jgi:2,5-diketo-D-gluconate reductase B
MEGIDLSNSRAMPILGLGTWGLSGSAATILVREAFEIGYRHIDTAIAYGNEKEVGRAIEEFNRQELFITSKVPLEKLSFDDVLLSANQSLERLNTKYLDLYLIHWPNDSIDFRETTRAFKTLVDQGKVRSFGVSNFTIRDLEKALPVAGELGLPIVVNQVELHPYLYQKDLLAFCSRENIIVTAYSPLAQGRVAKDKRLQTIAQKHNKTPAQVALRWLIEQNIAAIPKSGSLKHLRENFDVFDFRLSKQEIEEVSSINREERLVNPGFFVGRR